MYDPKFDEPRQKWIKIYFSWSENISPEQIHSAHDGFDAGANYQLQKNKEIITQLKAEIAKLAEEKK